MHCDICGNQIAKGQGTSDTKSERIDNAGPAIPTRWILDTGARHKTVVINLCPDCVRRRDRREVWIWLMLGCLFFGAVVAIIRLATW